MGSWGEFLKGGAGGALAGSAFGPWGTAIGGVAGGLLGLFGGGDPGQQYRDQLNAYAGMAGNRVAPQMGAAAQGGLSSFRGNQQGLVDTLEARSRGEGPSMAAAQLAAAQDRGNRQAQAFAAGNTGPNAALSQFQAQNMMGMNQAQSSQDAAQARIQEIYNAQNQLGLVLQGARGADEDMSRFNAGQMNQRDLANLEAKLRTMGLNDQAVLQALSQAGGLAGQPTLGDQLLAGGAGMGAFAATQRAANRGASGPGMGQAAGMVGSSQYNPMQAFVGQAGY